MSYSLLVAFIGLSFFSCIIVSVFNPLIGFYVLVGSRLLAEQVTYLNIGTQATVILGCYSILLLFTAFLITIRNHRFKIFVKPVVPFYLFIILYLLSFTAAEDNFAGFKMLLKFSTLPVFFLVAYNLIDSETKVIKSIIYFTLTSLAPMVVGFYQLMTGTGMNVSNFWGQSVHRIYSTFAHPNQYAFYLAMVAFALIILIQRCPQYRVVLIPIFAAVSLSIVFTFSRSVWFSFLFCTLVLCFFYNKLRIPALLMVILFALYLTPVFLEGMANIIYKEKGQQNSIDFRVNLSHDLLTEAFPKKPYFGFGAGSVEKVVGKHTRFKPIVPHNDYLRILIESGVVGLCGFFLFLSVNFFHIINTRIRLKGNPYFPSLLIMLTFLSGILIGTNHLGNVSTSGMWFLLYGILYRGFQLQYLSSKCVR